MLKQTEYHTILLIFICSVLSCSRSIENVSPKPIPSDSSKPVALTEAELAYIDDLGEIPIAVDPDWEPFEIIDEQGRHSGIAADLVNLIAKRTGIQLKLIKTKNWTESLAASKNGAVLLLSFLNKSPERDEWLLFTEPYFLDPTVFITREEHPFITNIAKLSHHSIVFPAGSNLEVHFKKNYPNLRIITVESEDDCFRMVSERKADITARSLTMAAYTIRKHSFFNLKIAGQDLLLDSKFRIGVAKTEPMLRDILNKGINSLSQQEIDAIINDHIYIKATTELDSSMIIKLSLAFVIVLALILIWVLQLRRSNRIIAANEELLRQSEQRYRLLLDTANEGILVTQGYKVKFLNKMLAEILGCKESELIDSNIFDFIDPEDHDLVRNNYNKRVQGILAETRYQFKIVKPGGEIRWVLNSGAKFSWEGNPAVLSVLTDITERVYFEEQLTEISIRDPLTNLYNRRYMREHLEIMCAEFQRNKSPFTLILLDLDHFKRINDNFGHQAGDFILIEFAKLILAELRPYDLACRYGGEEFMILCKATTRAGIRHRLTLLLEKVRDHQFEYNGATIKITASAGLSDSLEFEQLNIEKFIELSDQRLYKAKRNGRDRLELE